MKRATKTFVLAIATLALWCVALSALAQSAVMLPIAGHHGISPADQRNAMQTTIEALKENGYTVITHQEVLERLDEEHASLQNCVEGSCIPALLDAFHADVAVGLALWAMRSGSGLMRVYDVVVSFHDAFGNVVEARAEVIRQEIAGACRKAYAEASEKGKTRGIGHPSDTRSDGAIEQPKERASAWNYVIAGGFGAAAVGLLVPAIWTLATLDECASGVNATGGCDEVVTFNAWTALLLAGGAAAFGGGLYMLLAQPITVSADPERRAAMLSWRGSFNMDVITPVALRRRGAAVDQACRSRRRSLGTFPKTALSFVLGPSQIA
ncbi:MAG: hypothetical protein IPJ88_11480 [Myxococcales bacterium]|nr:MAG: hypothetical protein IPJ88_11480 [Myxococcales bacterium]